MMMGWRLFTTSFKFLPCEFIHLVNAYQTPTMYQTLWHSDTAANKQSKILLRRGKIENKHGNECYGKNSRHRENRYGG